MSWNHLVRFGGTVAATALCMSAYAASGVVASISVDKQSLGPADDLVVKVTLTNTTSTPQRLLKWQTPFGPITESLFDVTRDGVPVAYEGKHVKRPAPRASDYFTIQPGKSHTASVELSSLYDLSASGDYAIRFVAIGPESAPTTKGASAAKSAPAGEDDDLVKSEAVQVWIEGSNLRKSAPAPEGEGLTFTSCSASQQSSINAAFTAAKTMANGSVSYLNAGTRGTRYTKWFGTYDATRYNTVKTHFANIKNALDTKPVNVDCGCTDSYYAYVYPNQPYKIYVCNAFWSAPTSGTDSKGGTLVHELSHFTVVAGTDDWAYGQSAAASLATSNPSRAVDNADSHEYFSENTPALP